MVRTTRHAGKARRSAASGGGAGTPPAIPLVASSKAGGPSRDDAARRGTRARREAIAEPIAAPRPSAGPGTLSDLPIGDREEVRRMAAGRRGYRYPRAYVVIEAVQNAWNTCWDELGETDDACYLEVIADAIAGHTRRQSAERAGSCQTEVSKRRRKGVEIIYDQFLALLW